MCISSRNSNQPLHRSGFTLVELLIVMGIIVLLAAITLPSFKTLITSDKVNSASRVVKAHFEAARGRAIASGRPVAVILTRQGGDANRNNTVLSLSTGSVFPAYTGDISGLTGLLSDRNGDGYLDRLTVAANATLFSTSPPVFSQGDMIRINNSGLLFQVSSDVAGGIVDFDNPPLDPNTGRQIGEGQLSAASMLNLNATFAVYRKPTRSFEPPTVFPKGTCIDLSVSGFGTTGRELAGDDIMVIFSPTGKVESVVLPGGNRVAPSGLIHFMIGRVEQVNTANLLDMKIETDPSRVFANLNDPENVWLTINPFSGAVYTSQNFPGFENAGTYGSPTAVEILNRIETARKYATNAINRVEN